MRRMKRHKTIRTVVLAALGSSLIIGGGIFAWTRADLNKDIQGLSERAKSNALGVTAGAGLAVKEIIVDGRHRTDVSHLLAAIKVRQGDAILGLDVAKTKTRIEALPWVHTAQVERRFPGTINVSVIEREAVALWERGNGLVLIDAEGEIIPDVIDNFNHLMRLNGPEAPAKVATLLEIINSEPNLAARVRGASLISDRRWDIALMTSAENDGRLTTVRLPDDNPQAAWARLGELNDAEDLLGRDLDMIDLRYDSRLIVHVRGAEDKKKIGPKKEKQSSGRSV